MKKSPKKFKKPIIVSSAARKLTSQLQNTNHQPLNTDHQSLTSRLRIFKPYLPLLVFIQALLATLGSLYFSTFGDPVANLMQGNFFPLNSGFTPCLLCWFSRILMYPTVIISYVAMVRQDKYFSDYVLPFSILGVLLSIYHYSLQKFPGLITAFECSATHPCNAMEVDYFGFITIPFLALTAYLVIAILSFINIWLNRQANE